MSVSGSGCEVAVAGVGGSPNFRNRRLFGTRLAVACAKARLLIRLCQY